MSDGKAHINFREDIFGRETYLPAAVAYCRNTTVPESTLSKKHNAICYHKVRESVAAGWIEVGWIKSESNLADLFTKVLNRSRRQDLLDKMMSRWSKERWRR